MDRHFMNGKIVITVLGQDKVGLVAGVSTKLAETGINIVDIRQTIFEGGIFTMIMLADPSGCSLSMQEIKSELDELGNTLKVKIYAQHEDIFKYMHRI
jgi:ACT domain-containing protein